MSNKKLVVAGLAIAAAATMAVKPASATPSGLGAYPSTDIYGKGTFHFDNDYYNSTNQKNTTVAQSGLVYGFGPDNDKIFGRTEAGLDYNYSTSGPVSFGKRLFGNIKTQLYNNDASQTRLVAGGWGLGDDSTSPNYLYLLGSKNFDFGRIHLGVAHALSDDVVTRDKTSLQVGYDKYITPKLQFCIDYYSGKGPASGIQPTLYYYINEKADFGLGYFRLNDSSATFQDQIYLCFDYNFDFKKSAEVVAPTPAPETNPANPATN